LTLEFGGQITLMIGGNVSDDPDEEGTELPDLPAARENAVQYARFTKAETLKRASWSFEDRVSRIGKPVS
jgi:hypothetical protein